MHKVIPIEQLRRGPAAALFEGGEDVSISIFVTGFNRGEGPSVHLHPYPEVFVVKTGTAAFTVGDHEFVVTDGHIVLVPANRPHGFKGAGNRTLRVLSVHPTGTTETTWL